MHAVRPYLYPKVLRTHVYAPRATADVRVQLPLSHAETGGVTRAIKRGSMFHDSHPKCQPAERKYRYQTESHKNEKKNKRADERQKKVAQSTLSNLEANCHKSWSSFIDISVTRTHAQPAAVGTRTYLRSAIVLAHIRVTNELLRNVTCSVAAGREKNTAETVALERAIMACPSILRSAIVLSIVMHRLLLEPE